MPDDDVLDEMILDADLNLEEVGNTRFECFIQFVATNNSGELLSEARNLRPLLAC